MVEQTRVNASLFAIPNSAFDKLRPNGPIAWKTIACFARNVLCSVGLSLQKNLANQPL